MKQPSYQMPFALLLLTMSSVSQAEEWIQPHQPLLFSVAADEWGEKALNTTQKSPLRFFVNHRDVTALVERVSENQYCYLANKLTLPAGDVELKIYEVTGEGWHEIDVQVFKVLNQHGFKKADISASYSLTLEAQLDAGAKGEAVEPDERQAQDVNGHINLVTDHAKDSWEVQANLNVLGFSKVENTLQFASKQENAPKVDLSEYIASVASGDMSLSIGHVSFGENPLLISGLANRGVNAAYRINERFDLSITAQNGSNIVGWDNFLGLDNTDHQILASTLGIELDGDNPENQRLELTLLNGKTQSIDDFGIGEVTDTEKNRGWGIYYRASIFSERVTIDSAVAQSEYENTDDELLFQEEDVIATASTKDTAWHIELGGVLVQENYDNPSENYATRLRYRKEYADPFYRTLAAAVNADTVSETYSIEGNLQYANWNLTFVDSEDNVDDINNILKTGTRHSAFSIGFNVKDWLPISDDASTLSPWPTITMNLQRVHQVALNNPDADESDFNGGSHLPDQVNKIADVSLDWEIPQGNIGYLYSWSEQDNRQEGRELADFKRVSHGLNFGRNFLEAVDLSVSIGRAVNEDLELKTDFINRHGNLSLTWQMPKNYVLELGYSVNEDYTNIGLSESDTATYNVGISHQWQSISESNPITIQWFIRYALQRSKSQDQAFDISSFSESWVSNAGITISY
ncbi:MAG: hypothetical protein MI867_19645 [Pseudomonadales bacterium]|nr:hypothetical protein [Pseudomonadales bacterium]